jgi:hypothetical protein
MINLDSPIMMTAISPCSSFSSSSSSSSPSSSFHRLPSMVGPHYCNNSNHHQSKHNNNEYCHDDSLAWHYRSNHRNNNNRNPTLRRRDQNQYHINKTNASWDSSSSGSSSSNDVLGEKTMGRTSSWSKPLVHRYKRTTISAAAATTLTKRRKHPSPRLLAMLQSDLKVVSPLSTKTANSNNTTKKTRRLEDCQQDIDKLLTSLQSTDFIGQIDLQYHAQYLVPDTITISTTATTSNTTTVAF